MKPAKFDYYAPTTVDEAVELLARNGPDARVLAGGQTLVPMMNFRLAAPSVVVDLNRIPALSYIDDDGDTIRIGAMTRQRAIEFSPVVADKLPLLAKAIKLVGHLPTRSRGTIGGSIANADPAAEIPMVLQALDGTVVAHGPKGERVIAASELFRDAMTTALAADEILVEVRLPTAMAESIMRHRGVRQAQGRFRHRRDRGRDRARGRHQGASRHRGRFGLPAAPARSRKNPRTAGPRRSAIARPRKAAAKAVEPTVRLHASAAIGAN